MDINYVRGCLDGAIVALVINFILRQMSKASGEMKKRKKPLDTFPDAIQPKLTPAKIVRQSTLAIIFWVFWLVVLLLVVVLLFSLLRQWLRLPLVTC